MVAPKLRFKDDNEKTFGEWGTRPIKEILTIGSGRDYKHLNNGHIPVYGTGGLMTMVDDFLYDGETVCIGRKGTIDKPFFHSGKIWTVDTLFYTHKFIDVCPRFVYQLFLTINWKEHNEASGVPSLSKSTIEAITVNIPRLPEQNKIANFLTAVDDRITQLAQKYDLLARYKKGVMQQIFSQKSRFKDDNGKVFGEWDETELLNIASKVNTKNKDNLSLNVLTNSATQGVLAQKDYFDREITTVANLDGYYIVEVGDFVYNPRVSVSAPVGPIKMNMHSKGLMSPLYTIFRFKTGFGNFYKYFFESTLWHDYIKSVANSGARHDRMNIIGSDFFNLPVPQPSEIEQTKIANFLTAIDDKIAQAGSELEVVREYKRGLLQQMFV